MDGDTPTMEEMLRVVRAGSVHERYRLARDRATPEGILEELTGDPEVEVRDAIACRSWEVPAHVVMRLAEDPSVRVRRSVAGRYWIPESTRSELDWRLFTDEDARVRAHVAARTNDRALLQWLSRDESEDVLEEVAGNERTPDPVLERLALTSSATVRSQICREFRRSPQVVFAAACGAVAALQAATDVLEKERLESEIDGYRRHVVEMWDSVPECLDVDVNYHVDEGGREVCFVTDPARMTGPAEPVAWLDLDTMALKINAGQYLQERIWDCLLRFVDALRIRAVAKGVVWTRIGATLGTRREPEREKYGRAPTTFVGKHETWKPVAAAEYAMASGTLRYARALLEGQGTRWKPSDVERLLPMIATTWDPQLMRAALARYQVASKQKVPEEIAIDAVRWAATVGDLEMIEAIVNSPCVAIADVRQAAAAEESLALRWAARSGQWMVVEQLLAAGADVHACDDEALRWAAEFISGSKERECIRRLLQAGATPREEWPESVRYRIEMVRQKSGMAAPGESNDEQAAPVLASG